MASYKYIKQTGSIVPDTSKTRNDIISRIRHIKGFENMDFSDETPQGGIVNALSLVEDDIVRNNAYISNQFNPDLCIGVFLDAIGKLTGSTRYKATYSIIKDVELRGLKNTYIPNTLKATSIKGDEFKITSETIIAQDGLVKADFIALKSGAIVCDVGELNSVSTSVLGLESIINPNSAIVGKNEENDIHFRRRRQNTLALQGTGTPEAIISGVYSLNGVRSLKFLENQSSINIVKEEVNLVPNSFWICVDGGDDIQIAQMIKLKKDLGCAMNGNTIVSLKDEGSNQNLEYKFQRPTPVQILIKVTVKNSFLPVYNIIPFACEELANGNLKTDDGFIVGRAVSPFEIASAINEVEPLLQILNVELSLDGINWQNQTLNLKAWEVARVTQNQVSVVVV